MTISIDTQKHRRVERTTKRWFALQSFKEKTVMIRRPNGAVLTAPSGRGLAQPRFWRPDLGHPDPARGREEGAHLRILVCNDFGDPAHCRDGFGVFGCAGPCRDHCLTCHFEHCAPAATVAALMTPGRSAPPGAASVRTGTIREGLASASCGARRAVRQNEGKRPARNASLESRRGRQVTDRKMQQPGPVHRHGRMVRA